MRAVVQRVSQARVRVDGSTVGEIGRGLLVLLGVGHEDGPADVAYIAGRVRGLRLFPDEQGKMNLGLEDIGGAVLVVSQFTLYGDCRHGRRPSFVGAAPPDRAVHLYEEVVAALRASGLRVETGVFQAHMDVELVNDGPVTVLLDSSKAF
ncbi:MAG TPA: D-aminoacyl-tRNA deacylase [Vicinamibacterales bacterium]